ncbi:MAG: hypothetical protein RMX96_05425 [Nostoc sp. ChiSLP02]|nr:hypothetical protein [Nostoc sp. DedSLP05]MDZ8103715.1 hypothetical protein [Nostoc sp. DedSLP01]MDZ8184290.1 hypothetical protein [Nostoc sp. ChiSLP02]
MEPFNFSKAIGQEIDFEMQRLGWTTNQEQEHLIKTYGKRSRTSLTEEELLNFLQCLKSQPTPALDEDLISQTDIEREQLSWTPEQVRQLLIKTYGKRSRTFLTYEELQEFKEYLQSQSDPPTGF